MHLRAGVPLLSDVHRLLEGALYRELVSYNEAFLSCHRSLLRRCAWRWRGNPMQHWSRRWEYPFVAQRIEEFASQRLGSPLQILDTGSGVTYFPYFLSNRLRGIKVTCCDRYSSYRRIFAEINRNLQGGSVSFVCSSLQSLPFSAESCDIVYCISVLEHTDDHVRILNEFRRVLRPGGLLLLTFDVSLDGRSEIPRTTAAELLRLVSERFAKDRDTDYQKELDRLDQPDEILTTDHARRTQPDLLPWKHPLLQAIYDVAVGRGWTRGFRSKSCFCLGVCAE